MATRGISIGLRSSTKSSLSPSQGCDEGVTPWPNQDDPLVGLESGLPLAVVALGGLAVLLSGLHVTRAGFDDDDDDDIARQVTVFGVLATPGAKTVDSRLSNIHRSWASCSPTTGSSCWMPAASASSMENRSPVTWATATRHDVAGQAAG